MIAIAGSDVDGAAPAAAVDGDVGAGALRPGEPMGVYVHFPFCGVRCPYCDFAVDTRTGIPHDAYADAGCGRFSIIPVIRSLESRSKDIVARRSIVVPAFGPVSWSRISPIHDVLFVVLFVPLWFKKKTTTTQRTQRRGIGMSCYCRSQMGVRQARRLLQRRLRLADRASPRSSGHYGRRSRSSGACARDARPSTCWKASVRCGP